MNNNNELGEQEESVTPNKTIELSLQNIRKIKDSEIKIDKSLLAKLVVNNDQECFDMVTISPNESHDGDMSGENIASIYDYNNAKIIMKLWNNLCEKPMGNKEFSEMIEEETEQNIKHIQSMVEDDKK